MIRVSLQSLRSAAANRRPGYLDEVLQASVATDAEAVVLPESAYRALRAKYRPGLGDMVASGLAAIGVTKERAQQAAARVGIKDCGCAQRQAALNSWGRRLGVGGP